MEIITSFFKGLTNKIERAQNERDQREETSYFPVKLVEPSLGKVVEIQVVEQDEDLADWYMYLLKEVAKYMTESKGQWTVTDKTIKLTFDDSNIAEAARRAYRW